MHKEFDAFIREEREEPITFTVAGEMFTCVPMLPLGILATITRQQTTGQAFLGLSDFLLSVVVPDEPDKTSEGTPGETTGVNARLSALMSEPYNAVAVETWADIVEWILEEFTGRPTQRRSSSRSGSSLNGDSLKAVSIDQG